MSEATRNYESPFSTRYASKEMQFLFSADMKFRTWRRLWIALAKGEKSLGLPITDEQIAEMEAHAEDINYDVALARERECRHDVMSHIYAYGVQCPSAKEIIHLGATSSFVSDNTDIIVMEQALRLVRRKIITVIGLLSAFARTYKDLPALAYTHLLPAQLTTVGKRATLWINDLLYDLEETELRLERLELRGIKGATGTQSSFLELFDGDERKIRALERFLCKEMGFRSSVAVSGQTYSRKIDYQIVSVLAGIAQSAMKFSNDMRLLASFKEMEEPHEPGWLDPAEMPYQRNPMRCERIAALARYVMVEALNPALTAGAQWFERTLDDSANRRLAVAEAFLGVDAILGILLNVCDGLVVYPKVIEGRVMRELPFMAADMILKSAVKKGGDAQALEERLHEHMAASADAVKEEGIGCDLLERIAADPIFGLSRAELDALMRPERFIGRAPQQVTEFLNQKIRPILSVNQDCLHEKIELIV